MRGVSNALHDLLADPQWEQTMARTERAVTRDCFHCGRSRTDHDPVEGLEGEVECHNLKICEHRLRKALAGE